MNKYLSILLLILTLSITADAAGRNNRPKHHRMKLSATEQASRLASAMKLTDAVSAKFIPLYINYCGEIDAIFKKYPVVIPSDGAKLTDAQLRKNNDNRFAIARAILEIREKYYKKYTKILTPTQIDILYRTEKRFRPPHGKPIACLRDLRTVITIPDSLSAQLRDLPSTITIPDSLSAHLRDLPSTITIPDSPSAHLRDLRSAITIPDITH